MPSSSTSRPYTASPRDLAGISSAWPDVPIILRSDAGLIGIAATSSAVNVRLMSPLRTTSANEIDSPFAETIPFSTNASAGSTPSSAAPASRRIVRPAAPACDNIANEVNTDHDPPVTMYPHFGSESTCLMRTSSQLAPSSSATIRANAVPTCCPISALAILMRTSPLPFTSNQTAGEKLMLDPSIAISSTACSRLQPGRTTPRPITSPAPALLARKVRRVTALFIASAFIAMTTPPRRQRRS